MRRFALPLALMGALALPALSLSAFTGLSQGAAKAAPTTAPPAAAPAKFYRPVKGIATIEVLQGPSKKVGTQMVTVVKVKNTSAGRIDLLQYDEYWYDQKVQVVSGSTDKYRKLFNPGEIIELTIKSPIKPNLYRNQIMFSHAGGKIEAKAVKKFE
jgi:hypothetical protein